jgi:hypothetical protein
VSTLTVSRSAANDIAGRHILLLLDGVRWVTLQQGQTATREVTPGPHVLKANNTLFKKSLTLELGPDEHARVVVANRAGPGTWLMMAVGAPVLYLDLRRE